MMVTTKGRYALRMMADIARQGAGARVPLREIADRQDLSAKYLEQLAGALVRAGLLVSSRGAHGGYSLTRDAGAITAGAVMRAVEEGGTSPVACLCEDTQVCPRRAHCETLPFWEGLSEVIDAYVDGVTLAEIARGAEAQAG